MYCPFLFYNFLIFVKQALKQNAKYCKNACIDVKLCYITQIDSKERNFGIKNCNFDKKNCDKKHFGVSVGICGSLTFGCGKLDEYGYWEYPCTTRAREHEQKYPEDGPCCPFNEKHIAELLATVVPKNAK